MRGFALIAAGATVLAVAGCTSGTPSGAAALSAGSIGSTAAAGSARSAVQASVAASSGDSSLAVTTSPPPVRTSVTATVTTTVAGTVAGTSAAANAPKATAEPAAAVGDCPYLSAAAVQYITGQHHGPTQLISVLPQPICVFYRSDGGLLGSVRVIYAADPASAIAAVNQHVPVAGSQPVSQPAGWTGGSITTRGQMNQDSTDAKSVYAVAKGNIVVVAEEEESPSVKARRMAICAIYGLQLQAGAIPADCTVA